MTEPAADAAELIRQVAAALRYARWSGAEGIDRAWAQPYAPPAPAPAVSPAPSPAPGSRTHAPTPLAQPQMTASAANPRVPAAAAPSSLEALLHRAAAEVRGRVEPVRPAPQQAKPLPTKPLPPAQLPAHTGAIADPVEALAALRARIGDCQRCPHAAVRSHIVHGTGNPRARLMLVGVAPGPQEDAVGLPWQGEAGELLDKMLSAMGLARADVFQSHLTLCRAPGDGVPSAAAIDTCSRFLRTQLQAVRPEVVLLFGEPTARFLLRNPAPMTEQHGQWQQVLGVAALATWDPADVVRQPAALKRLVWADLQLVMARLGISRTNVR